MTRRRKQQRPPLEVPEWLIERAARDDPPTTIEPELVTRLRGAGVEQIIPTRLQKVGLSMQARRVGDRAEADAIGVAGDGLAFSEPLEHEPAPVANALVWLRDFIEAFDPLRRMRLAAIDMRLVEDTARQLRDRRGPARMFERVLETGLLVVYARPYLESSASVGRRWWPTGDDADLHSRLVHELRSGYHAHADRTPFRTLTDTTALLGLPGPPTFAETWYSLTDDDLEQIEALARQQAERFETEAHRLGAEAGEQRDRPASYSGKERSDLRKWLDLDDSTDEA